MSINVFDPDKLSTCVLDRTWPNLIAQRLKHDPEMLPKTIQNRVKNMLKQMIDFKTIGMVMLGRSGGMRGPPHSLQVDWQQWIYWLLVIDLKDVSWGSNTPFRGWANLFYLHTFPAGCVRNSLRRTRFISRELQKPREVWNRLETNMFEHYKNPLIQLYSRTKTLV